MKSPAATVSPSKADEWFKPWRFAIILGLLITVCFPLVLFGFETFFFHDFGAFGYPLAFYHKESFWRGEVPLWNPYSECGLPFLAQWNTLTLYPLSIFYLIFPLSWSLGVFNLGHLFLAGIAMYFLAHRWTGNRFAACVAGTVFAFNGLTWQALMWPNNIAAFGWMPWVVLGMQHAWQSGGRKIILAAFAGAMQLLSGAPEIIILTWFFLGILWLDEFRRGEIPRGKLAARFLSVLVLVAGLGAAQMLPFLDLLAHSQRGENFDSALWAMPLSGWANFLVPLFNSFQDQGIFWQNNQYWTTSYYLGVGTIALAVLAFRSQRTQQIWLLAGATVFCLVMALGERAGIYALFKATMPFLSLMRYPIKFVALPLFLIPLLASYGASRLVAESKNESQAYRKNILTIGIVLLLIMAALAGFQWHDFLAKESRTFILASTLVRGFFLIAIIGMFLLLNRVKEFKLQVLLRICLLFLFWFDVYTHEPNPSPTVSPVVYEPDTIREYFHWEKELKPGQSRAFEAHSALNVIGLRSAVDPVADVNGRRLALFADYNLIDHAAKTGGFFSLELREVNTLLSEMRLLTNASSKLIGFLGVEKINDPLKPVDWVSNTNFMPMITGGQAPVFVKDKALNALVISGLFEPERSVYFEMDAMEKIKAGRADVKINSSVYSNQKISFASVADKPAVVVIAQAYYHNWHAFVDGQPVKLWRANYAFQALEVPAGEHQVRLVYEDRAFQIGAISSIATLLIMGVAWVLLGKKPKQV